MTDLDQQEQFIELRAKGMSFAKISEQLGVSKPTLIKWSRELEIDIKNMRAVEQEALREKYLITKEKRLEQLGENLDKIKQEIAKRDLSEIATEKLFYLNLKILQEIKTEETSSLALVYRTEGIELGDFTEVKQWNA